MSSEKGQNRPAGAGGAGRPGRRLLASSATVSIFNGVGVVAGFALDATIAASFGIGTQTDAFFSAWRVPYLTSVVLNMAVSSTLVPVFARGVEAGDSAVLSKLFSRVFNALFLLMALLGGLGMALSPWLVGLLFAGLPESSQQLAASLSRVLFLTLFFSGAMEVLRAYLYGHQVFALPTAINFVRSGTIIVVLLLGRVVLGQQVTSDWAGLHLLAWGFVAGVAAQLAMVAWQAARHTALRWRPLFDLRHPRLREMTRLAAAPTAGALVRQGISLVETVIASYLPVGSVTVLNYASRLTFVLSSVFLSSVTTASMPMLSRSIGSGRRREVLQTLVSALRLVAFLAIPLGLGVAALGVPVIRLLFERGRFDAEASRLTGAVLSFYAFSILFLGYFRVVQAYFYAALRAGVVLRLFILLALSSIGLDLWLTRWLGVAGIAVGFSVGTLLTSALGLWLLRGAIRTDSGDGPPLEPRPARSLLLLNGKVLLASLLLAVTARGALLLLPDASWAIVPAAGLGGLVFLAAAWLLRVSELQSGLAMVRRRGPHP